MSTRAAEWIAISKLLRKARDCVGLTRRDPKSNNVGPLTGTLQEFEEFLSQNELELAWDALAVVAEGCGASRQCWACLAEAAQLMHLPKKAADAAERAADK